jgi:ABC-2 type transport system permease protein
MNLTAWVSPPPHPLVQTLRAEWTKLRTGAGPFWLLAGVAALTVAVGAAAADSAQCQSATCGIDPAKVSFTGLCLARRRWPSPGVLAIGDEYSTGMITLSLTAPVLIASALAVAGSALAGWLILPGRGFTRRKELLLGNLLINLGEPRNPARAPVSEWVIT